ncbi:MAG: TonB-dependent receptor [Gammaproteobacteria bacterium]|nr:TonB-dependent receptor [Gammaproteobacteria bacterium]MCW8910778.1 TonB-dependent receptor [Gammaproteobacteria bacterium]MCW9004904.1 TonB-dependent receptor [Gammaproteobacteria bacterium]MCW9054975.1 TonB-dependent receptor [Gammaproteobacteria bacterium]
MKNTTQDTGLLRLISMSLLGLTINANAEDLGVIQVESSTITTREQTHTEASTVSTIGEETIKIIDPKHLNEILQTVPGLTADVRGGEVAEIHMRGVGQQEFMNEDTGVAIVIDGVPVMQNGGKVRINLEAIETIKVIKGSASYLYGNTARGGAVVITTKKPKNKNEYNVSAVAGSYGYTDYVGTMYKGTDDYALHLNANIRSTDGFWEESALETESINGKIQYYINEHSDITFAADITDKYEESIRGTVRGVTEATANPEGAADGDISYTTDNNVDLDKYFITYANSLGNDSNLLVTGYFYNDLFDFRSTPYDSNADGSEDSYGTSNNEDIIQRGIKSEYQTKIASSALMIGIDLGRARFNDYVETVADFSATVRGRTSNYYTGELTDLHNEEDKLALYAELKSPVTKKLTTTLNIRQDKQDFDYSVRVLDSDGTSWTDTTTDRTDSFTNTSYRAGLAYILDDKKIIFSNVSTGFRLPTIDQKYWGDFDSSKQNNPDLDVETSINYEMGVRGEKPLADNRLNYSLSLFQIDSKDIISRADATYDRRSLTYENVGEASNRGVELTLSSDHASMVYFNLSYTYLDAFYTKHTPFTSQSDADADGLDDIYDLVNNQLPRTPKHTVDISLGYKPTNQLTLLSEIFYRSNYYADEENQVKMDGHHVLNLQARYKTKLSSNSLEIFIKVDNVFDDHFFRTAYVTQDRDGDDILTNEDASIFVDPGRVYYAGLEYIF